MDGRRGLKGEMSGLLGGVVIVLVSVCENILSKLRQKDERSRRERREVPEVKHERGKESKRGRGRKERAEVKAERRRWRKLHFTFNIRRGNVKPGASLSTYWERQ